VGHARSVTAPRWDHVAYCDAVEEEIGRFAALVKGADPELPVPTCPEWTLGKLIRHVGGVHRWAGRMVREVAQERVDPRQIDLDLPDEPSGLASWLASGAAPVVATLRAADPDSPMWAWGLDQHARFWPRRLLHETTVHRTDAEQALGRASVVDAAVAADGIEELLDNLPGAAYFRPAVRDLKGSGEQLLLVAADTGDSWLITLGADGYTWARAPALGDADGAEAASVVLRGDASDVLLALYNRRPVGEVTHVEGDTEVLTRWLANSVL
jgi:uncharacterized protein (TIGR03083 family)